MAGSTGVTEHQQAVSVELHTLVAGAFQALDGAGVRWVLVRGFEKLSDPTGDLDILVLPADLDAAASALGSAGFVETNSRGHGAHRFFVGYAPDEQRFVVLDLVTLFAFGPERVLRVDAVEACVARRTVTGTVARLAPDDEFWATLLHAVVNRGEIRDAERGWLALAAETRPAGVLAAELIASGRADQQTLSSLRDAVRRADWAEAETIGRSFGQQWQRKRWVQVTGGSLLRRLTRRLAPSRSPASARGLTVALLGPDGAGKSTLTSRLTKAWPIPTETIYMGVFRSSNRERYWRIIPGLALAVKLLRLRTRATRGSLHRRRGGLVLFDRYTYDAILRPGRRTLRARLSYTLLARICPPPDVVVVLDAPGEVMFARKGEHTVEILEERRQRYLDMAGRLPQAFVVDATMEPDLVTGAVSTHLWQLFATNPKR